MWEKKHCGKHLTSIKQPLLGQFSEQVDFQDDNSLYMIVLLTGHTQILN